jgi:hypothetical protein
MMGSANVQKIEDALSEVLLSGWGEVTIEVNRGRIAGFSVTVSEKLNLEPAD